MDLYTHQSYIGSGDENPFNSSTDDNQLSEIDKMWSDKEVYVPLDSETNAESDYIMPAQTTPDKQNLVRKRGFRGRQHTDDEWEAVKETVRILYLEQDNPLPTVIDVMSKPPHNFRATTKTYKTQFKRWGFEKYVTQERARRPASINSVKDGVRKFFGADRISRYFKRRKITDSHTPTGVSLWLRDLSSEFLARDPLTYESSTYVLQVKESVSELGAENCIPAKGVKMLVDPHGHYCDFVQKGNRKFRIKIYESDYTSRIYHADSWGSQEYHLLSDRKCNRNCPCRPLFLRPCTNETNGSSVIGHLFQVSCERHRITVNILEPTLASNLGRFIGEPITLGIPPASVTPTNGLDLLKHYRKLKDMLDTPGLMEHSQRLDLKLLVEGFLEDASIWDHIGLESLQDRGILDSALLDRFMNQKLMCGIQNLDREFQKAEKAHTIPVLEGVWGIVGGLFELDSTPVTSRATFDVPNWERCKPLIGDEFSSVVHPSDFKNHLPSHYVLDNFQDSISKDYPQLLPVVSRAADYPLVFDEELNDHHTRETFFQETGYSLEEQQQQELNMMLLAACKSGPIGTVRSLITRGASVNFEMNLPDHSLTPLIAAVNANHEEIARYLVLMGAHINAKVTICSSERVQKYTALHLAVRKGYYQVVQSLLQLGADIDETSTNPEYMGLETDDGRKSSFTSLQEAAYLRRKDIFKLLLLWDTSYSLGLKKVDVVTESHPRAHEANMFLDAIKGQSTENLEQLLSTTDLDINTITFNGTALSIAAQYNQPHKIKLLLNRGADVNLASLYLSRSGQKNTASLLVKAVYGESNGSRGVHGKFIQQYYRTIGAFRASGPSQLKTFQRHCPTYQQAWSTGIGVMKNICRGSIPEGPSRLSETMAFLTVARAVAEASAGNTGEIGLIDKFDCDLQRWQLLFPDDNSIEPYRRIVHQLWNVDLSGTFFLDLDIDDEETLGRFKGLVSRLIDGAQKTLDLDQHAGDSLNESLAKWRQNHMHGEPTIPDSHSNSTYANYDNDTLTDGLTTSPTPPSLSHVATRRSELQMGREQILQASEWILPRKSEAGPIYIFDVTGIAEDLIRGVIFSVVFIFIHGLRSVSRFQAGVAFGVVERFAILLKYLGLLEACGRVVLSDRWGPGSGQLRGLYKPTTCSLPTPTFSAIGEPSNQWYSFFNSSMEAWM